MTTTIFFDIGNVLVGFDYTRIWNRLAMASPFSSHEIQLRLETSDVIQAFGSGQLSSAEFFHNVQMLLQLSAALPFERFCQVWADMFWTQQPVVELAQQLHQQYAIFLLSNTDTIHWNWLMTQFPIFTQVDGAILSFQVGFMKPATEIYREAIRISHSTPEQCVYIDDIAAYVDVACQLGIRGIQYQSPTQLRQCLQALQIAC